MKYLQNESLVTKKQETRESDLPKGIIRARFLFENSITPVDWLERTYENKNKKRHNGPLL